MPISNQRKEVLRPLYIMMMKSPGFHAAVSAHTDQLLLALSDGGLQGQLVNTIDSIIEPFAEQFPEDVTQDEFNFMASRLIDEMLATSLAGVICSVLLSDGDGGVSPLRETLSRVEQFTAKLKNLATTNHAILSTPTTVN